MKICVISQNLTTLGGVQRVVTKVINYFQETFMDEICVIMPLKGSKEHCFEISKEIKIIDLSKEFANIQRPLSRYIKAVNRRTAIMDNKILVRELDKIYYSDEYLTSFVEYLNEGSFDWVIGVGDIYALLVAKLADRLNAKTAGWMHSTFKGYYETKGHASYGSKKLNAIYLKKLDKLFVLNTNDKKQFDSEFLVNSDILYNPIEVGTVPQASRKNNQLLFVGRLNTRVKGLDYLIEIMERVISRIPSCRLVIVGNGAGIEYLEKKIFEKHLEKNIQTVGYKKNVDHYYLESKLLLSTSRWEGFGMSILEAMANGIPCIAFENDGPNDIIQSEVNGILVPKFNTEMFSNRIIEFLTDEKKYSTLAKNAYLRSEDFSINVIVTQLRNYLKGNEALI